MTDHTEMNIPAIVVARAEEAVAELRVTGRWTEADDDALATAFDAAAEAALAVPSLVERAPRARRIARRLLPPVLHQVAGRMARRVDRALRRFVR